VFSHFISVTGTVNEFFKLVEHLRASRLIISQLHAHCPALTPLGIQRSESGKTNVQGFFFFQQLNFQQFQVTLDGNK